MGYSAWNTATILLIPSVIILHLLASPYTKVEESFNIQATHDILTFGYPSDPAYLSAHFDHVLFPGPVPRTFAGPLSLAAAAAPLDKYLTGQQRQTLVRALLGIYNSIGILSYRYAITTVFGKVPANWFSLFSVTQFHVMYYATRTLPNFFVYGWSTVALALLLPLQSTPGSPMPSSPWQARVSLIVLAILGIVFRSEIAVLLGAHVGLLFLQKRLSVHDVLVSAVLSLAVGLLLTVPLDSFFWQKPLEWPELTAFIFNVVEGKSADWGVSPFYFYFVTALPRLLLNPLVYVICLPLALALPATRVSAANLLAPNLAFVAVYSLLPHKERRFIVYVLPPLTAAASLGAAWIWNRRGRRLLYRGLALALAGSTALAFVANMAMLAVSSLNYPGAHAMHALHRVVPAIDAAQDVRVHMDTLTIMTGVTRFLEFGSDFGFDASSIASASGRKARWFYDKTEQLDQQGNASFWASFDYALAELPERLTGDWEVLDTVDGFAGLQLLGREDETPVMPSNSGLLGRVWNRTVPLLRKHVTGGRWARIRMRPLIHVLRNRDRRNQQTP